MNDKTSAPIHPETTRGSKVPSERVVLLVITALLAATVIVICRLSLAIMLTERSFQKLRDEHEALKRNFTGGTCLTCEEGWEQYGRSCYYFSTIKSSWTDSRSKCQQQGGELVKIESREEQVFLDEKLRDKIAGKEDKFWIGLTDAQTEDTWLWADGSPLDKNLSYWGEGEPDNWTDSRNPDGEDCARMGEKGGAEENKSWFDTPCRLSYKYICEKPAENGKLRCL
ncbi:C-type lectin domain family 4 member E-like [Cheilinus undulatus]|uniref:C-type lectin domain family 4 member E-like n=1 Tax=Cheilinus undulatus TaxID=241271 RepID=UPI001BD465C5|nr:C-type lectin domain family 4 member E-like [Cheilinus undulatus]